MKNPTTPTAPTVLGTLVCLPVALFHIIFILVIEACLFAMTLFCGITSGKMIVHNMYAFAGKAGIITGPVRAFKEVLWGGVMMMVIVLIAVVPFEKKVLKPLRDALYKKIGIGPDLILSTANAYVMGSCFAEASVLFEVRYCKTDFDFHWLNGPVRAFIYYIEVYKGGFLYGSHTPEGLEEVIMFPLVVAFSYPLYSFMRCYLIEKSPGFSVVGFLDTMMPKSCCCESEGNSDDEYKIDWVSQIYGWVLEFGQVLSLCIPLTALIQLAFLLAGTWRPGFFFIGFGIVGFTYALAMVLMEANFPKSFKRARNGVEVRILLNLAILTYFVTKNFLVYFEQPMDEPCQNGQMEMKSRVSRDFARYFTLSIYAASKIILLCVSFYNGEKNTQKIVQAFMTSKVQRSNCNKKMTLPTVVAQRKYFSHRNLQCRACTLKDSFFIPMTAPSSQVFEKTVQSASVSQAKMSSGIEEKKLSQC